VNLLRFRPTSLVLGKGKAVTDRDQVQEALLLVRCQLGERAAYDALVRSHADPLMRHVRRLAGSGPADDLAQDVWLRAFRGIARLRAETRFRPWLFGIAHHVVMDHFRLRYVAAPEKHDPESHDAIAAEEPENREELLAALEAQLAALPVIERETLTLFYLEELSLAEIALIQAVPVGTVKSRLFRARALLRSAMRTQGDTP
jgi:RNA polymerase sigma factor (sigma-70 family)